MTPLGVITLAPVACQLSMRERSGQCISHAPELFGTKAVIYRHDLPTSLDEPTNAYAGVPDCLVTDVVGCCHQHTTLVGLSTRRFQIGMSVLSNLAHGWTFHMYARDGGYILCLNFS
jgi:hypothetical protein